MVSGETEAVEKIIEWARKGPKMAKVTEVRAEVTQGQIESFDLLTTA